MAQELPENLMSINARKYGTHQKFQHWGISGLTPLAPLFPKLRPTPEEYQNRQKIEVHQRKILGKFTARELADMDVITDRELKDSTLDNPILPIFEQRNWESQPSQPQFTRDHMYPLEIDGQRHGDWSMHNPLVTEKMVPILKLASRTLTSMCALPWFGGLLFGQRNLIDPARIQPRDVGKMAPTTSSFKTCDPRLHSIVDVESRLAQAFFDLEHGYNFTMGFSIPGEDPRGPEFDEEDDEDILASALGNKPGNYASCTTNHYEMKEVHDNPKKSWGIWMFVNSLMIQPLFRKDLTSAETKMIEWSMAVTLVHEMIHALCFLFPDPKVDIEDYFDQDLPGPYFDTEAMLETGFSFENALNGGIVSEMPYGAQWPIGFWFSSKWPSIERQRSCTEPGVTLINPGPWTYQEEFPIPASFYEEIQQKDHWEQVVQKYGHKVFHFRTLSHGTRTDYTVKEGIETPWSFQAVSRVIAPWPVEIAPTSENMRDRLHMMNQVRRLQTLPPDYKAAETLAQSLLRSSVIEKEYWIESKQQGNLVRELNNIGSIEESTPEGQATQQQRVMGLITTIVVNHDRLITKLLQNEPSPAYHQGIPSLDRKLALLAWNRGTSIFLAGCGELGFIRSNPEYNKEVFKKRMHLELCRLRLWPPAPTVPNMQAIPDAEEQRILNRLQSVFRDGDALKCSLLCEQLFAIHGCSLFPKACAYFVMLLLLSESVLLEKHGVFSTCQRNLLIFGSLRHTSPQEWKPVFEVWNDVATQAAARANQIPQARRS